MKTLMVLACVLIIFLGLMCNVLFLFVVPVGLVVLIYVVYYWGKRVEQSLARIQNRLDRVVSLLEQKEDPD